MEIISLILNLVFGGSLIVTLVTLRAQKKQASATAESTELDNTDKAVKIWRELAEQMEIRYRDLFESYSKIASEVQGLRADVSKLRVTNDKILKIIQTIDHDNLEQKKREAESINGNG